MPPCTSSTNWIQEQTANQNTNPEAHPRTNLTFPGRFARARDQQRRQRYRREHGEVEVGKNQDQQNRGGE